MRPIVKNFTGKYKDGTRYRVRISSDCDFIYVKLETQHNGIWHYQTQELGSNEGSYLKGLMSALQKAQEKWGFKLLKEDLKEVA